jgi:cell division protein FtsQ
VRRVNAAPAPRRRRRLLGRWTRPALAGGALLLTVGGIAGTVWWLGASGRFEAAVGDADGRLAALSAWFGLAVADVQVEGRQMTKPEDILAALGAKRGMPILVVDPAAAKTRLEALPWVRAAAVERRLPDTGKLALIDVEGMAITAERLDRYPGLPLVVGEDAPAHAAALLDMLRSEPALAKRVAAAVRVGGRRWNLKLDGGVEIQLPEENPAEAWAQLAKLERTNGLLARNIEAVDLRLPDRLVVRTVPEPQKEPPKKSGRPTARST